jgi:hypothetical protein
VMRTLLEERERLELYQGMVQRLVLRGDRVEGAVRADGSEFHARCVVLTAGTFLRGSIKMGRDRAIPAGRAGDSPCVVLAEQLAISASRRRDSRRARRLGWMGRRWTSGRSAGRRARMGSGASPTGSAAKRFRASPARSGGRGPRWVKWWQPRSPNLQCMMG